MTVRALAMYRQQLRDMDRERDLLARARDVMIRDDYASGATIAELSRVTGLTRTMLYRILDKEERS